MSSICGYVERGLGYMNNERPKLQIPKTKGEWLLDILGTASFLAAFGYLIISWGSLPEEIPGHFNAAGEVDRWGSRYEILILPIISVLLWGGMSLLEKKPHIHNYPARLNENNAHAFYVISRKVANMLKNACLFLLSALIIQTVRVALGDAQSLGSWFLPLLLILTIVPIVWAMIAQSRIK